MRLSRHPVALRVRVLSRLRGPLPQRTLPVLQLTAFAAAGPPGHPRFVRDPAVPCHPHTRGPVASMLAPLRSGAPPTFSKEESRLHGCGGVRVARGSGLRASRLAGRVRRERFLVVGSGPVGERATPTPGQDPHTLAVRSPAPIRRCLRGIYSLLTKRNGVPALVVYVVWETDVVLANVSNQSPGDRNGDDTSFV
jgi:hypothetical protein